MSAIWAVIIWVAVAIGLKFAFIARDPAYRAEYVRWTDPRRPFRLLSKFPLHEIGYLAVILALGAVLMVWATP